MSRSSYIILIATTLAFLMNAGCAALPTDFDADPDLEFADLDVMAIGPVAGEVSTIFDFGGT